MLDKHCSTAIQLLCMGALVHGLGAYEPTCTPLATPLIGIHVASVGTQKCLSIPLELLNDINDSIGCPGSCECARSLI